MIVENMLIPSGYQEILFWYQVDIILILRYEVIIDKKIGNIYIIYISTYCKVIYLYSASINK